MVQVRKSRLILILSLQFKMEQFAFSHFHTASGAIRPEEIVYRAA